jgi:hypothetical protein
MNGESNSLEFWKKKYPEKFASENKIFKRIHREDTIFIGSACAEPQYLVAGLIRFVESYPHAFFDTENKRIFPYTRPVNKDLLINYQWCYWQPPRGKWRSSGRIGAGMVKLFGQKNNLKARRYSARPRHEPEGKL